MGEMYDNGSDIELAIDRYDIIRMDDRSAQTIPEKIYKISMKMGGLNEENMWHKKVAPNKVD